MCYHSKIIDEFEYIPIQPGPFCIHIHNPTPYDPHIFIFDNRPSPLLHFRASHIALMVEAESHLSVVTRLQTPKGDAAEPQIATLLRLYRRQPGRPSSYRPAISVPDGYETFSAELERPNAHPSTRVLNAISSSPRFISTAAPGRSYAAEGFMSPSSSAISCLTEDADLDLHAGADMQLLEYGKEPSITWEELRDRPLLFGGEETGRWRFASVDQICRSSCLDN